MIEYGWFDVPLGAPTRQLVSTSDEAIDFINTTFGKPTNYYYSAQQMRKIWSSMLTNGIVPEEKTVRSNNIVPETQLGSALSANIGQGLELIINNGVIWIEGAFIIITEPEKVRVTAGQTSDVVLRLDTSGDEVLIQFIARKRAGASMAADLVRDSGIYEMGVHEVVLPTGVTQLTAGMVKDHRLDMTPASDGKPCCGLVGSLLQPDVDAWYEHAVKVIEQLASGVIPDGAVTWPKLSASVKSGVHAPATATLSGNIVTLTTEATSPGHITFPAPADHSDTHTYTLNGSPLTITDLNGESLSDAWKKDALVDLAISYVGGSARGFFKGGGGGKIEVEIDRIASRLIYPALGTSRTSLVAATDGNGNVVVMGGSSGLTMYSTVEKYTREGVRTTMTGLSTARTSLAGATDGAGNVLALGGWIDGSTSSAVVDRYTPDGVRSTLTALAVARSELAAAMDGNGNVLALGGRLSGTTTYYNTVDRYTSSGVRTTLTGLSVARTYVAASADGEGNVLALGGSNGSGYWGTADKYTPAGVRTTLTSLSVARTMLSAVTDAHGNVWAVGGQASSGMSDVVEMYSPSGVRTTLEPLFVARRQPGAARDGSGNVIIMGGYGTEYSTAVDGYTADGQHGVLEGLSVGRGNPAVATDGDGRVLVLGGNVSSGATNAVDAYEAGVDFVLPPGTKYRFQEHSAEQVSSTGAFAVKTPNSGYIKPATKWKISA